METDLTPKQQASEALRQADNILLVTGQHPSSDQVASLVAFALILRKLGKKVTAIISDQVPQALSFLPLSEIDKSMTGTRDFIIKLDLSKSEVDKLRYNIEDGKLNIYITPYKGGFSSSDMTHAYGDYKYDVMVVLGVPTKSRLDRAVQAFTNMPIINIDFHRSNENYGAVNLIEPNAASLSEILVSLGESLQNGIIDEPIATALLTGIISSTDRFTATHTTPKALTVAAQLLAAGARQQQIVKSLFRGGRDNRDSRPDNRPKGGEQSQSQPRPITPASAPQVPPQDSGQTEALMSGAPVAEASIFTAEPRPAVDVPLNNQMSAGMTIDIPNPGEPGYSSDLGAEF
jgi:bifunctional oligoribonuclease and PAP phosphatase NrnA